MVGSRLFDAPILSPPPVAVHPDQVHQTRTVAHVDNVSTHGSRSTLMGRAVRRAPTADRGGAGDPRAWVSGSAGLPAA